MPTPRFDHVADIPLTSDEHLLERVRDLVQGAYRQQLWFMFLDDHECQLPLLMPYDTDASPDARDGVAVRSFLDVVTHEIDPGSVVVVLERPGPDDLSRGDRAWFALVDDACRRADVRQRGPILVSDGGVRWIAPEDYLVA